MKKIIINMLLLFGTATIVNAQATDPNPMAVTPATQPENNTVLNSTSVNPYCTELYKSFWVWDKASVSWVQQVQLVTGCPVVPVPAQPNNPAYQNNNAGNIYPGTVIIKPKPGGE